MVHGLGSSSMTGSMLPSLLLCATIGLLLSFTTGRLGCFALAGMAITAAVVALLPLPQSLSDAILVGVWLVVIVAAALAYFPPVVAQRWALPLAVVAGVGAGSLSSLSGRTSDLILALPVSLLFVPGRWLVAKGYGLGNRIVASWMIAIAMLSTFVSLTPTPGYKPDHME